MSEGELTIYDKVEQGSDEWLGLRRGRLTASEMPRIVNPTGTRANNEKSRQHVYEILAQRISGYTEPTYVTDDMLRGLEDQEEALAYYSRHIGAVHTCGFMVRTIAERGIEIGCSPDGLVGSTGLIEVKSRRQKYQVETLCSAWMPAEFMVQVQTQLWVSGRDWCDFISFNAGLPMMIARVHPIPSIIEGILDAAENFETTVSRLHTQYLATLAGEPGAVRLVPTVRRVETEIHL